MPTDRLAPLTLHGIPLADALKAAMETPPPPPEPKAKPAKPNTKKKPS